MDILALARDMLTILKNHTKGSFLMRKLICLFLFLVMAFTLHCQAGSASKSTTQNFSVDIPEGWTRFSSSEYFMLTREGVFSQYILVLQRRADEPFSHTKSRLSKDMSPKEAAGVITDELSSDDNLVNFQFLEYVPAKVGRYNGFRIVFRYQDKNGRNFRTAFYGLLNGNWFYSLRYCAQEEKYADEDLKAFEKVVDSFKIGVEIS
jgi:hypothetical protein